MLVPLESRYATYDYITLHYNVNKKQDTLLVSITSQNIKRFSKFFHC